MMTIVPLQNYLIPLLTDYGFKITFGNEKNRVFLRKALQLLIKSSVVIKHVQHLPTEIKGLVKDARKGLYDTACVADNDLYFIIEMQVGNYTYLIERLLYYISNLYISQAEKGTEGFAGVKKVHCICITRDTIFEGVKEYYHKAHFKTETGFKITDKMELIFVELEKFTKLAFDIDNEFDELIFTMKNAHTIDISNPAEVPPFWQKDWLRGVVSELNLSTMSPQNRALYNISIARLIAINEQEEIDRREMKKEITNEVVQEVTNKVTEEVTNKVTEEVTNKVTEEVTNKVTEEVTNKVTEEVTNKVTEEVTNKVTEEVTNKVKIEYITKLLTLSKMTLEEIADFNDVSVQFVLNIKEEINQK